MRGALSLLRVALLAIPLASVGAAREGAAAGEAITDSCEQCHRDPDLLVTNKKLYDYYQEWSGSVHRQEGVACEDCHGGDPTAPGEKEAHGDGIGESDPASGIYYKNVVDTCGVCHDEIHDAFVQSNHFEHVEKKKNEAQGPTCVTCHGSINSEVLDVNSVEAACARCHNEETENHPENPEKATKILNRFLSINRFYRYISIRARPEEARAFFETIDPKIEHLAITWHTFDLEAIDSETHDVLSLLTAKREQIRAERRQKSAAKTP